ncbi:response regulator transcription factor [Rhizobium leguminosarum]|uniref:Response regulator n=1 Tax=Rhizobium leguminosarum TaxID=384 RepID=A0A6P0DNT9_RHILE|nr:response regulator transcription factor [Rhizobium leguminosarum]MBY5325603.1 response regulator transcription factor [Rhizobium leguminosarum]NEK54778.1 response regulator [Rhizobium leguminosarum]
MPRILLIEDDVAQGNGIQALSKARGFAIDWVKTLTDAEHLLPAHNYDVVLLDLVLPDGRGESILRIMSKRSDSTPVIILTAHGGKKEITRLIEAGAHDFLTKPWDGDELFARIHAAIRSRSVSPLPEIYIRGLVIRPAEQLVERDGKPVSLTQREWAVFECLLNRRGHTVRRVMIEDALYEQGSEIESNAMEVYISRIRRKIGRHLIETDRGFGYRLVAE